MGWGRAGRVSFKKVLGVNGGRFVNNRTGYGIAWLYNAVGNSERIGGIFLGLLFPAACRAVIMKIGRILVGVVKEG